MFYCTKHVPFSCALCLSEPEATGAVGERTAALQFYPCYYEFPAGLRVTIGLYLWKKDKNAKKWNVK